MSIQRDVESYCSSWPAADRAAWCAALSCGTSIEDDSSIAANWRPQTRKNYTIGYKQGLDWLAKCGALEPTQGPGTRWSAKLLNTYIKELAALGYRPASIHNRVISIERVLSQIAPDLDRRFISQQLKKIAKVARANRKPFRLKKSVELMQVGIDLMRAAQRGGPESKRSQVQYRTGMQIALLAARPLRIKNFANLEFGKHITKESDGYWMHVDKEETKTRKTIDLSFPEDLVPFFEEYVAVWRARLCGDYQGRLLWVSSRGAPLGINAIYKKIIAQTKNVFGPDASVNPHLFRDCLATSIAVDDPAEEDLAQRVLGNKRATVEATYDHGSTREAGLEVAIYLDKLRS